MYIVTGSDERQIKDQNIIWRKKKNYTLKHECQLMHGKILGFPLKLRTKYTDETTHDETLKNRIAF